MRRVKRTLGAWWTLVLGQAALLASLAGAQGGSPAVPAGAPDWRHISRGRPIPGGLYCDQPYIVRTRGEWLCVMTSAEGHEGSATQNVFVMRSADQGRTWTKPLPLEPPGGPEASYAVLLQTPWGRIYCFYNHNTDNVREVKREDTGVYTRVDSLGHYVFRFSDDGGRSWSPRRYEVPIREFRCDRENVYGGRLRFFWNVGRPLVLDDQAILPHHKVGAMGAGFFAQSEGCFLTSSNILSERDPLKITWRTLPEGDAGLRTPAGGGRIAEEQSLTSLSDGSIFCVYRTVDGHPACSYSRDGGRSWTPPEYLTFSERGRRVKHPRAANFIWKCANGRYLYWFHNHGGSPAKSRAGWDPYADRNPAWLAAAREVSTPRGLRLHFSQPEVLLYDDDPFVRMSYPDLVEEDGRYFVTETQKHVGRVHEVDGTLIDDLFGQGTPQPPRTDRLLLEAGATGPAEVPAPRLPAFHTRDTSRPEYPGKDLRAGITLEAWLQPESLAPGAELLSNTAPDGAGFRVSLEVEGRVRLDLSDGREQSSWVSDPATLAAGKLSHLGLIVDGGPKLILVVADGVLQDGGEYRQFGWGRFSPSLRELNGAPRLRISRAREHGLRRVRIFGRALRVSELVNSHLRGPEAPLK